MLGALCRTVSFLTRNSRTFPAGECFLQSVFYLLLYLFFFLFFLAILGQFSSEQELTEIQGLFADGARVFPSPGNTRAQSSQLAEPLWTDPGLKGGIAVRELISTLKKKSAGEE